MEVTTGDRPSFSGCWTDIAVGQNIFLKLFARSFFIQLDITIFDEQQEIFSHSKKKFFFLDALALNDSHFEITEHLSKSLICQ